MVCPLFTNGVGSLVLPLFRFHRGGEQIFAQSSFLTREDSCAVLFQVLLRALDAGGNVVADLAREVVNEFGIEHAATIATGPVRVQPGVKASMLAIGAPT